MCGRFALGWPSKKIQQHFQVPDVPELVARYNIAPSQDVAVIRQLTDSRPRQFEMLRWGLIPPWAKDMKIGYKMINARAETISEKPSFRTPFNKRRCLIAADGFYEWLHTGKTKQPYHIKLKDNSLFGFAGLWESWHDQAGKIIESCTIITTTANTLIKPVHDRMPVIIQPADYNAWLGHHTNQDTLQTLLKPYAAEEMVAYRVSSKVNSPQYDAPDCLLKITETLF